MTEESKAHFDRMVRRYGYSVKEVEEICFSPQGDVRTGGTWFGRD